MERLTNEQRLQIVEIYYQNSCSVKNVHRLLRPYYGRHNRPCESTIRAVITKFRTKFTLLDIKPSTRMRTVRTEENIAAVASSVNENREMSIRRRSQQLGLCYSTTWKILSVDLGLKAYKIQLLQELKPNDLPQRLMFGEWALEQLDENPLFYRKIVFSDEAHFWLNGYVNKQNCRIWSDEQPHAINELPMHPEKTTVWCGLWAGGIIGPFFFKDDRGRNVTVNGERYRAMIHDFFLPQLAELNLVNMWFQQDGATCHTARETMNMLKDEFGEQLISRNGPVSWPPRSCDLTPLDYFLWGYVKSLVYVDKPNTIEALQDNITRVIRRIQPEMLEQVTQNWTFRMDHLKRSRGQHLNEVIFKT
ncbi:Putative DD41D transposase [Caligus rogercresseyi]|uniref:DD41D transposase n=5 Tax=Caligus rogercresseyi TaxID=217165 RepID=A0A7T8HH20_CALRO|nr:Putative DD41D transposase [Caligus rogercresseyi]